MFIRQRKAAKNVSAAPTAGPAATTKTVDVAAVAAAEKPKQNKQRKCPADSPQGKFYLSLKTLPSKSIRPSFFIFVSSFVMAVRSTER